LKIFAGVKMNTKFRTQTAVISLAATVGLAIAAPRPAAAFTYQDDPNSYFTGDSNTTTSSEGPNNNTRVFRNLEAVNTSNQTLPQLAFVVPWVWPKLGDNSINMTWRNDLDGWYTNNYDGTSLVVKLANFPDRLRLGDIADITGQAQLPLTQPCTTDTSPSCTTLNYPPQTRDLEDKVPALNLGAFAPNETKRFDMAFTYDFGDGRSGTPVTAFYGNTISPEAVPEPSTIGGTVVLGGIGWLMKKKLQAASLVKAKA